MPKTRENLDLGGHELGYSWVAGQTPPNDSAPGEWFVRMDANQWTVLFRSMAISADTKVPHEIYHFPLTDDGERAAKTMANKLVNIAWESYRAGPQRRNKIEEVLW